MHNINQFCAFGIWIRTASLKNVHYLLSIGLFCGMMMGMGGAMEPTHAITITIPGNFTNNTGNGEVNGTEFNSVGLDLTTPLAFNIGCGPGDECWGADAIIGFSLEPFMGTINGNFVVPGTSDNATVSSLSILFCCSNNVGSPGQTVTTLFDVGGGVITSFNDIVNVNYIGGTAVSNFSIVLSTDAFQEIQFDGLSSVSVSAIPEPSTMLLFGTGLAGLAAWRYRKRMNV